MKIYAFINGGSGTDWVSGMAIAEDGHCVGQHVSSHDEWAKHDMGATEDKAMHYHDYVKRYGEGNFEVIWVDDARPGPNEHQGLAAAYKLNQELGKKAEAEKTP